MAESDEWSSDANKAVIISLVQAGLDAPNVIHRFHPHFTYPIFGEAQTVFGYQGLRVNIRFAAHDLRPNFHVKWEKEYKAIGDTKATDVKDILEKWLPLTAFESTFKFNEHLQSDESAAAFKPPGELFTTYKIGDKSFEIWRGTLTDRAVQEILKRTQIFIPFFIEGGTYINLEDPEWSLLRWRVFLLYEKKENPAPPTASSYSLVGYSTVYRYYLYTPTTTPHPTKRISKPATFTFTLPLPSITPSSLPSRERISQFLILPPYQSQGHGSHFYDALMTGFLADPAVHEVTVEDPNEAFDDLRDHQDLARLRKDSTFTSLAIDTSVPVPKKGTLPTASLLPLTTLNALRTKHKIAPRQFSRLVEMQLLSRIPASYHQASRTTRSTDSGDEQDRAYFRWRLLAKQRLYRFNRTLLAQLDRLERIDKLEEVLGGVEADYERLLRAKDDGTDEAREAKRKAEGENGAATGAEGPAAKKIKT